AAEEQRRICDFVNGACYIVDGCAKRISEQIVLYAPEGVDVAEAMPAALKD
ncbi:cell division protein SepF, partial [Mitsuokella sp.]